MPVTGKRVDPFRNYNFLVEIQGIAQASFMECSGLESTTEVISNREGGQNTTVRKHPGKTTYTDITLKWGMTSSNELAAWRQQIIDGIILRKSGSIVVYDTANKTEVGRWNFVDAWPTKWTGPSFNASDNQMAVETLVLAHEGISRAS